MSNDALRAIFLYSFLPSNNYSLCFVITSMRRTVTALFLFLFAARGVYAEDRPEFRVARANEPPMEDRWTGPVLALVDGGTASAAEMIAGALKSYRRGLVLGARTYGKGCAQEYVDDVTGLGVLRMTTLLFALPDGTPVQRVGLEPSVIWALPSPLKEREADLPRAAPTWIGPDIRDHKRVGEVPWATVGSVGPCADEVVCRALAFVGKGKAIAKR